MQHGDTLYHSKKVLVLRHGTIISLSFSRFNNVCVAEAEDPPPPQGIAGRQAVAFTYVVWVWFETAQIEELLTTKAYEWVKWRVAMLADFSADTWELMTSLSAW